LGDSHLFEHCFSEDLIEPGLIALALPAKPGNDVRVEADGELLFYGTVERIVDRILPNLSSSGGISDRSISDSGRSASLASLRLRAAVNGLSAKVLRTSLVITVSLLSSASASRNEADYLILAGMSDGMRHHQQGHTPPIEGHPSQGPPT
jgi:hypothetical protein